MDAKPKEKVIYCRVPASLHRTLRRRALEEDRHTSDLVRDALAAYVATPKKTKT